MGAVEIGFQPEELDFALTVGEDGLTECQMINQFKGSADVPPSSPVVTDWRSAGRPSADSHGHGARDDRALRATELGELDRGPAQEAEFVLCHSGQRGSLGFCPASQAAALR